ncbi:MAG: pilus assembly PilX N-terminal domain-containing protein [Desulfobacterota bacterium]|nr:pilus assembly PilX N-terminal domain-containing protein [Thermodesulfobacteriota bacterium]
MRKRPSALTNESGMALVIALVMMVVLTLIGLAATFTSNFEILLSGEKRRSTDAFFNADSGANVLITRFQNFVPKRRNYNPFTDPANTNPTNVTAIIDYDPFKMGPPEGGSYHREYAYFWVESRGSDRTEMAVRSMATVQVNVYREIVQSDSITEVVVD